MLTWPKNARNPISKHLSFRNLQKKDALVVCLSNPLLWHPYLSQQLITYIAAENQQVPNWPNEGLLHFLYFSKLSQNFKGWASRLRMVTSLISAEWESELFSCIRVLSSKAFLTLQNVWTMWNHKRWLTASQSKFHERGC